MAEPERRKLERVQYWQGQMLRSRDFRDIEAIEAQRRWWHNRAVHNAYGIAEGLAAEFVPSTASPTSVHVSRGVAYDIFGRELILERPQTIPLPSNLPQGLIGGVRLLLRYKSPAGNLPLGEISEVCWMQPGPIRTGTIEFAWKLARNTKPADGVAVFSVYYTVAPPPIRIDPYFVPIFTRPLARPLLASGATVPGNTAWQPWTFSDVTLGVQTTIDTSAAGFTRVPCYFAWLEGPLWNPQSMQLVPAMLQSISNESTTSFTFSIWLQFGFRRRESVDGDINEAADVNTTVPYFITDPYDFSLLAQQQDLYVSWIGCQMPVPTKGCSQQQRTVTAAVKG
jgi:hypothetical protein